MTSVGLRVCVDVDDVERGIAFFTEGLGLTVGRRFDSFWVELLGATAPIDLLASPRGTSPVEGAATGSRDYGRHWTPVHLDFVVEDLDAAVLRAVAAGARLERPIRDEAYGRLANLADPFGHGICLLQMSARGYDALVAGGSAR